MEGYAPQQYPNGIYQATYQQAGFETNTFYTGAVQVLTNPRPPSASDHAQMPPRTNGSYSHTPSPVPAQAPQQNTQRANMSGQYHQDYQNYAAPATTPTGSVDNAGGMSRPSSVNSVVNVPTSNPNYQAQTNGGFTTVSTTNFSPGSNSGPNFSSSNISASGNGKPGYPQVNSHPQLVSHNSSGYPGDQYSGSSETNTQCDQTTQWTTSDHMIWEQSQTTNESAKNQQSNTALQEHHPNSHLHYDHQQLESKPPDQNDDQYRVNINSRIKSMILNKQQNMDKTDVQNEEHKTGHFLSFSHHRRPHNLGDGGGFPQNHQRSNQLLDNHPSRNNQITTNQNNFQERESKSSHHHHLKQELGTFHHQPEERYQIPTFQTTFTKRIPNGNLIKQENIEILADHHQNYLKEINRKRHHHQTDFRQTNDLFKNDETRKNFPQNVSGNGYEVTSSFNYQNEHIAIAKQEIDSLITKQNSLNKLSKLDTFTKQNQPAKKPERKHTKTGSTKNENETKNNVGVEIPVCSCFPPDRIPPPEPGSYYTHLGKKI